MPSSARLSWLSGLVVALTAVSLAAQQPTFRADVQTVLVYATVQDSSGRLVPDLTKTDFQIFEDGRPRAITVFSRDPQPLSIALMLDRSQDMGGVNQISVASGANRRFEAAVVAFIDALGPLDRMSIGTFGLEIAVGANLTRDRRELARVLDEEMWSGGGTPLWQALGVAMTSLKSEPGRHVVLAFTNGRDTGNLPGWKGNQRTVERQAAVEDAMVYAISPDAPLNSQETRSLLRPEIEQLAEATGGGHFNLPRDVDATEAFRRVADELRHQYLIGFSPSALDGATHTIEVRVLSPGMRARARKTFVADK